MFLQLLYVMESIKFYRQRGIDHVIILKYNKT